MVKSFFLLTVYHSGVLMLCINLWICEYVKINECSLSSQREGTPAGGKFSGFRGPESYLETHYWNQILAQLLWVSISFSTFNLQKRSFKRWFVQVLVVYIHSSSCSCAGWARGFSRTDLAYWRSYALLLPARSILAFFIVCELPICRARFSMKILWAQILVCSSSPILELK